CNVSSCVLSTDQVLATTVNVEQVFSQGCLVFSHIQSCLSVQSTHALLCLRAWCQWGLVNGNQIKAALREEVDGKEDKLSTDWDAI
ncbi:hypothetical protein EI94DRAFT_1561821, partial [Lactarius quietus]